MTATLDRLLTSKQVAAILGVSQSTVSRWRTFGGGPTWVNLGGIPRYSPEDIDAFIQGRRQ